ncbi:hypothetical protein BJX76DRAFT_362860 [Aspergillus varians]
MVAQAAVLALSKYTESSRWHVQGNQDMAAQYQRKSLMAAQELAHLSQDLSKLSFFKIHPLIFILLILCRDVILAQKSLDLSVDEDLLRIVEALQRLKEANLLCQAPLTVVTEGSNILVIGGSTGIGAAVAKLAAAEGDVHVSIASSNLSHVETTVQRIQTAVPHAQIKGYTVDVGGDDAESRLEKLLVEFKFLHDVSVDFLRGDAQFLVFAPLLIAKIAPSFMVKSYRSSITFTSGRTAEKSVKGAAALAGWGAALFGITRTLALDLAPIRVNLVSPGTTDTEIQGPEEQREKNMAAAAERALLGKVGTPVAEAYIYLMKDSNNTGTCASTSRGGGLVQ